MRLMWLTTAAVVNMCVLPMVMIFFPVIWLRLACMLAMGIMVFIYISKNWKAPIMFVDPQVMNEIQITIKEDIKPALNAIPTATGVDEHVQWAKTGADKLSQLIEKLRAPDAS